MIKIFCKASSIDFGDVGCNASKEIFPPYRMETFPSGVSVFGSGKKSFYIPNDATYQINGVSKTFSEVTSELLVCFATIEGNNEVQCFANLASFPPVGEDCVIYIDEATKLIYHWDGATYVELSPSSGGGANLYETIVAADGSGDFLLLSTALAAGETSIWIKNGTYIETGSPTIISNYTSISGESIGGVKIILTAGRSIKTIPIAPFSTGTIAIINDTKIVTLTGGVFPANAVDMLIRLNQELYKVATRDSNTQLTLIRNYKGRTMTTSSFEMSVMYSGIQIQNLSAIGDDGVTVNTVPLVDLNNIHNGYAENMFIGTTQSNCFILNNSSNFAINKCIAWNAGADTAFARSGFVITSDNVKITNSAGTNCKLAGITLSGESITIQGSDFNNNDSYGIFAAGIINSQYVIDSCTCDSNNLHGISTGANVGSVTVTNSTISNTNSVGIYLMGSNNTITGNLFVSNNAGSVRLSSDSTLTANVFKSNTGNIIHAEGTNITVTGNILEGVGSGNGIFVKNSTNCKFSHNTIKNFTDGVDITTSGDNNRFFNNEISGCVNGFRIEASITGTLLDENDVHTNTTDYADFGASQYVIDVPVTAIEASALSVANGSRVHVSTTDATFTSLGYWAYEAGVWIKLGNTSLVFTSTGQTITSAATITIAHGLSTEPDMVQGYLQCTTAEEGYSIGDKVSINTGSGNAESASGDDKGIALVFDATNLIFRFGADANVFRILNKSTGEAGNLINGNWDLYLKAIRI